MSALTPDDLAAIRERVRRNNEAREFFVRQPIERDLAVLLVEVERLREEVAHARIDRAEFADEAQKARDHVAGLRDLSSAVARVTPCTCSAQRSRADAAEVEVGRLREGIEEHGAWWRNYAMEDDLPDVCRMLAGQATTMLDALLDPTEGDDR